MRVVITIYTKTCCFLGQREIRETDELKNQLRTHIEHLITKENVETFIFGSKSNFNSLCYDIVTEIKKKYGFIKRIYIRAEYPVITDTYKSYLLEQYEDTYYPQTLIGATSSIYVKRNREMIALSDFCIIYYEQDYCPKGRNSGSKIALDYAKKCGKKIYRLPKP